MSRVVPSHLPLRPPLGAEHVLLLKWLLLVVVVACAGVGVWYRGLAARVWTEDPTGITLGIAVLSGLMFAVAGTRVVRLSRALNHVAAIERWIERHGALALSRLVLLQPSVSPLPEGCATDHLRRLARKAERSGGRAVDQRLLLDVFETTLRRGHGLVWFVADLLLTLGLVGTVVGFVTMLAPLAGLDANDAGAMKRAIGSMSGGMAVALYTTLAGLVGGVLLRIQGLLLDEAVDEAVRRTTELTELHVIPFVQAGVADAAAAADGGAATDAAA
ncbi:MAG TPA: MotA/TolQ/ExbB proton channel family protein [Geminicoccaceae bacterium]|nr:MotA/TolQ/ExbB proton channel family protein [Geminicoccaceae bacterium]